MTDNAEIAKSFLSYNSRDKPAVKAIKGLLERGDLQRGVRPIPCWFDKDDLRSQGTWMSQLEDALATCGAAVVFFGPDGLGPFHKYEIDLLLKRAMDEQGRDAIRLVLVLLPGAQESAIQGFISLHMWADFRKGLDDAAALQRLRAFILGEAPKSGPGDDPKVPKPEIEPYRGLEPFEGQHAIYFFGRDNEIKELCGRLQEWPFTAVIGGSGSGKSSIVRAGLQTELATQERPALAHTTTITVRPGSNPIRALADQVAASLPEQSATIAERLKLIEDFDQQFRTGSDKLLNLLSSLYPKDDQHILLVIDQFEELFTHSSDNRMAESSPPGSPTSDSQQTQFVELLAAVAKSQLDRLRIVITLRADFFDRCLSVPTLKSLIENRTLLLGKLSDDALRTVIEAPAFQVGAYFEKGLVARILKDVENQNGSLPLLQHALKELWEQRRFGFLTDDAYDETGGVEGALKKRANATLQNLSEAQREIAKNLFLRLTTLGEGVSDTRRRVRKTELYPEKTDPRVIDEVLKGLSSQANRLIVTNDDGTVEVTHEALIQRWDTLKGWLAENRDDKRLHDRLRDAANEWADPQHGRDRSYLWEGGRLDLAEKFDHTHPNMLTALEREFLGASIAKREQAKSQKEEAEREKLRQQEALTKAEAERARLAEKNAAEARENAVKQSRLKRVGFIVAGVALVAAVLAGWQTWNASKAKGEARKAEADARNSEKRVVHISYNAGVTDADATLRSGDHRAAQRILRNTQLRFPDQFDFAGHYVKRRAMREVFDLTPRTRPEQTELLAVAPGSSLRFAWFERLEPPKSTWRLWAWEPTFKETPRELTSLQVEPLFLAYSYDGHRLIWAVKEQGLHRLDLSETTSQFAVPAERDATIWATSPKRPEVFWSDGLSVHGFDYEQGKPLAEILPATQVEGVTKLAVSADGNTLVAANDKKFATIHLGNDPMPTKQPTIDGKFIAVSADGQRYVVGSTKEATLLNQAGQPLHVFQRAEGFGDFASASFSPDGQLLAVALSGFDLPGKYWLCDPMTGTRLAQINGGLDPKGSENFHLTTFLGNGAALLTWSTVDNPGGRENGSPKVWDTTTAGTKLSANEFASVKSWAISSQVGGVEMPSPFALPKTNAISLEGNGLRLRNLSRSITPPPNAKLISAAVSPDDVWAACIMMPSGYPSQRAYVRRVSGSGDWIPLVGNLDQAHALAFSPTGQWLAIGGAAPRETGATASQGVVNIWDISTDDQSKAMVEIFAERGTVNAVAFSPDGKTLATASNGPGSGEADWYRGVVRIWDPQTGQLRLTLRGHSSNAIAVAFSPDSKQVISCSKDEALLWDARPWSLLNPSPSQPSKSQ